MKPDRAVSMVAIVTVGVVASIALALGIDGYFYGIAIALISGIAGFKLNGFGRRK